ncbi:MAG: prolyl oligopeptidase family serine peptidase [Pseudomonadota bacterium]|nr:prolyl oligopeptidase family serine peptidase [Pseudomonadota bacterium]
MLSTRPEAHEPRGGDNVRLYMWERDSGTLRRLDDAAMMTQTRYGSPLYALDVRAGAGALAAVCLENDENAPFVWVDNRRVLALTLPKGQVSALLDEYGRVYDHAEVTRRAILSGVTPTATAAGTDAERIARDEGAHAAVLRLLDVGGGTTGTIATIPTHPFQGKLSVVVSPDARRIALMPPLGMIPQQNGEAIPHHRDDWQVEKKLGFVDLAPGATVLWATLPDEGRYPVELFGWSPDSRMVALRGRARFADKRTSLFVASADKAQVQAAVPGLTVGTPESGFYPREPAARWIDARRLLVQGQEAGAPRDDWWLVHPGAAHVNLSRDLPKAPSAFRRAADGRLVTLADTSLLALDEAAGRLVPLSNTAVPPGAWLAWPKDPDRPARALIVGSASGDEQVFHQFEFEGKGSASRFSTPARAELLEIDRGGALWRHSTRSGLFLRETPVTGSPARDLLSLNTHLADVAWGRSMLIDYAAGDGQSLKAAVILPPGYREGQRYPVITWIYPGNVVRSLETFFLNPHMPGLYNLQLYAAAGYVVLIPSMPIQRDRLKNDSYADLPNGVLPAVDRLVSLGIADPGRVGVFGQSLGGYGVYGLVTQTNRFKAAVAIAGMTDVAQFHGQFDPTARGYPGIEHEKSANWSIVESGMGFGVPPYEDQAFYWRNSPLSYVDRVETPLLLIHGQLDKRATMAHAETFFSELHRQGKTARLLRYWGDDHALARSPANIRDVVGETLRWFDRYLGAPDAAVRGQGGAAGTQR